MIAGVILLVCIFVFVIGMFKVFSEYGTAEGCGMMLISVIIAMLVLTGSINLDEEPAVEHQQVEEVQEQEHDGPELMEYDEIEEEDSIEITELFKPIEPIYDTVDVIKEIVEEFVEDIPQYDTLEVIEIETNHKLDIDSLMTVYGSDSVEVEIIQ